MASVANSQTTVVRTDRGLSIAGTRITLYDVMDYVTAGWPAHLIRDRLQLTDQQTGDVMAYIEAHRAEVEREYQAVLQTAEENRRYWQERNQDRFARIASSLPKPEHAEARAKLQAWKAKQGQL
jgi:uncharacterized protein (DUF433 family)